MIARDVLSGKLGEPDLGEIHARGTWRAKMHVDLRAGRHDFVADEPPDRDGEDHGPTPLEYVLAGLCACEAVTMKRTADKMRMRIDSFAIEANGVIDRRGRKGTAPVPAHFLRVEVRAKVGTPESEEKVQRLREVTERHCPVATLLQSAPLEFVSVWEKA
ncbi:MAG TPA: OsmC family protein [Candidatus Limnocylindria bacterium]